MAVSTYTKNGNKATSSVKLDKSIFGVIPDNHTLLQSAYVAYLANGRVNLANTKTRGEVRGGGKKPWRQKGTGRARFGSSRVPIWRGGGITFGPTGDENYAKKLNRTAKKQATRQALSLAAGSGKLKVIENLYFKDAKTAAATKFFAKIGATGSVLLAVSDKTEETSRAISNLSTVKMVQANYLSVYDILNADSVIITSDALTVISSWLGAPAAAKDGQA